MENQNQYLEWLKKLPSDDSAYFSCACPECGSVGLSFQYFSFGKSDFGWKIVWCEECNSGIQISRTRIPEGSVSLTDETAQKEFLGKHSYIRLIT